MKKLFFLFCISVFALFSEEKMDTPENPNSVLVGFIIRHGDIVDGVTPIYKIIDEDKNLGTLVTGSALGGRGGKESIAIRNNAIVKGLIIEKGNYFGAEHISRIRVIWQKWSQGKDGGELFISEHYGAGKHVTDKFITEINSPNSFGFNQVKSSSTVHTDNTHYISNLEPSHSMNSNSKEDRESSNQEIDKKSNLIDPDQTNSEEQTELCCEEHESYPTESDEEYLYLENPEDPDDEDL
jgi:hypothetical protein